MADAFLPRATQGGDTRITEAGDERATSFPVWFGVVALAAVATLSPSATRESIASVSLNGAGSLAATGTIAGYALTTSQASVALVGTGKLYGFGEGGIYGLVSFKTDAGWVGTTPFVNVEPPIRHTEQGDERITENGDRRMTEKEGAGGWIEPDRAWVFVSGAWRRFK